jgi:RNA polymerase subunit RPABC4/transcription elongation factor Spt4
MISSSPSMVTQQERACVACTYLNNITDTACRICGYRWPTTNVITTSNTKSSISLTPTTATVPASVVIQKDAASWLSHELRSVLESSSKNKSLIGTFDDSSFQLQLFPPPPHTTTITTSTTSPGAGIVVERKSTSSSVGPKVALSMKGSDPLSIGVFDMIGCPCVPLIGCYGDNYDPLIPTLLISMPTHGSVCCCYVKLCSCSSLSLFVR